MDNKPIEKQAENYLKSQLIKFGFNVVEPSFDKKGSDLIVIDKIKGEKTKFLIIQSKGRTLKKDSYSNVEIPEQYLSNNFIVFLYTVDELKEESLFMFTPKEIRQWKFRSGKYHLHFNKNTIIKSSFSEKKFNKTNADRLLSILKTVEVKNYTSVIIDGIFLEKAIMLTKEIYSEIWPNKKYQTPDLNSIIGNILDFYDHFKANEKLINCYLINSVYFDLENVTQGADNNNTFMTQNGNRVNVYTTKTDSIVAFEVIEQLKRLINNDNIILVADDIIYEAELNKHKENDVEIILVMLNENNGGNMLTDFKWGDIFYPLGISLGLERHEL